MDIIFLESDVEETAARKFIEYKDYCLNKKIVNFNCIFGLPIYKNNALYRLVFQIIVLGVVLFVCLLNAPKTITFGAPMWSFRVSVKILNFMRRSCVYLMPYGYITDEAFAAYTGIKTVICDARHLSMVENVLKCEAEVWIRRPLDHERYFVMPPIGSGQYNMSQLKALLQTDDFAFELCTEAILSHNHTKSRYKLFSEYYIQFVQEANYQGIPVAFRFHPREPESFRFLSQNVSYCGNIKDLAVVPVSIMSSVIRETQDAGFFALYFDFNGRANGISFNIEYQQI